MFTSKYSTSSIQRDSIPLMRAISRSRGTQTDNRKHNIHNTNFQEDPVNNNMLYSNCYPYYPQPYWYLDGRPMCHSYEPWYQYYLWNEFMPANIRAPQPTPNTLHITQTNKIADIRQKLEETKTFLEANERSLKSTARSGTTNKKDLKEERVKIMQCLIMLANILQDYEDIHCSDDDTAEDDNQIRYIKRPGMKESPNSPTRLSKSSFDQCRSYNNIKDEIMDRINNFEKCCSNSKFKLGHKMKKLHLTPNSNRTKLNSNQNMSLLN